MADNLLTKESIQQSLKKYSKKAYDYGVGRGEDWKLLNYNEDEIHIEIPELTSEGYNIPTLIIKQHKNNEGYPISIILNDSYNGPWDLCTSGVVYATKTTKAQTCLNRAVDWIISNAM